MLSSIDPVRKVDQVSYNCHSLTQVKSRCKQKSQIAKLTDEE